MIEGSSAPSVTSDRLVRLGREGRLRDRRVENLRLGLHAEVGRRRMPLAVGDRGEILAALDLLQAPPRPPRRVSKRICSMRRRSGCVRLGLAPLVFGGDLLVGHRGRVGDLRRVEGEQGELAVFRRAEALLVLVEIGLQVGLAGRADRLDRARVDDDEGDRALLVLQPVERRHQRLRHFEAGAERVGDLRAHQLAPHVVDEVVAVDAGIGEERGEAVAVEVPSGALEGRVLGDLRGDAVVGDAEPVLARRVVERGVHQEPREHLLGIDLLAGLLGVPLRLVVDAGEILHGDLRVADASPACRRRSPGSRRCPRWRS